MATIVGGMDMVAQSIACKSRYHFNARCEKLVQHLFSVHLLTSLLLLVSKKPHIIVATPGRLWDHLESTKGFRYVE